MRSHATPFQSAMYYGVRVLIFRATARTWTMDFRYTVYLTTSPAAIMGNGAAVISDLSFTCMHLVDKPILLC